MTEPNQLDLNVFSKLRELKLAKEAAKAASDDATRDFKQHQAKVFEYMETMRLGSLPYDGVTYIRKTTDYAVVQDENEFIEWAEINAPDLIEPKTKKGKLNEEVRLRLADGRELPPGVGTYPEEYVAQRSSTNSTED